MSAENTKNEVVEVVEEVVEIEEKVGFKQKHPVASKVLTAAGIVAGVVLAAFGIGKLVGNNKSEDEDEADYECDYVEVEDEDVE